MFWVLGVLGDRQLSRQIRIRAERQILASQASPGTKRPIAQAGSLRRPAPCQREQASARVSRTTQEMSDD